MTQREESITIDDALPSSLITITDPSHSLRMTPDVFLIMTPYRLIQGSWSRPSEGAAGARSAIEDTRLS